MNEGISGIGDRVRELRRRRGLTQEELADVAGLSVAVVKKIEQGGSARMETYHQLARALNVTTVWFGAAASPAPVEPARDELVLAEMRRAISPPLGIGGDPLRPVGGEQQPDLVRLDRAITSVAAAYYADRYDDVASLAPAIIDSANLHVRELDGSEHDRAVRLRGVVLGVTGRYLIQVRQHDLAQTALRDCLRDAVAVGDDSLAAAAVSSQAWSLLRQGRFAEVEDLCVRTADEIEPRRMRAATPDQLAAWGWLLLRAGAAAARNNRVEEARELHSVARAAAAPLPGEIDTAENLMFGTVTVDLKTIEAELILGHPERALELSERIPPEVSSRLRTGVNRHGLDKAKANLQVGRPAEALGILQMLRRRSPEWLRYQQAARDITEDIMNTRKRMPSREQRDMAAFLGLPVA
ncbi:hypothetical protein GCM10027589_24160 [Actinocorallia lasiicapitis]